MGKGFQDEAAMTSSQDIDIRDPDFVESLNELIRRAGGNPENHAGRLLRETMQNCLRLARDQVDLGEVKILSYAFREMRHAFSVFRPYRDVPKISVFGSARTVEHKAQYQAALDFSRHISQAGWMVITGAGDGIMRAGHGGAGRDASFGVAIRLPFETNANEFIIGDDKLVTHRYFFTRKLMFVSQANAVALFPGGFGTLDEGFEVLTLVQTGKSAPMPIVCVDEPGGDYWHHFDRYIREQLLTDGMIDEADLSLYHITDNTAEAVEHVLAFYRNYHSWRWVGDELVLRLRQAPDAAQLDRLNADFADLLNEGRIEPCTPFDVEDDARDLARLKLRFNRRSHGRLRQMIDQINSFIAPDAAEAASARARPGRSELPGGGPEATAS